MAAAVQRPCGRPDERTLWLTEREVNLAERLLRPISQLDHADKLDEQLEAGRGIRIGNASRPRVYVHRERYERLSKRRARGRIRSREKLTTLVDEVR